MRCTIALILVVALAELAAAQSKPILVSPSLPPIGLPLPPIAGQLPPIGLPLPPISGPPVNPAPEQPRDHRDFRPGGFRHRPPILYVVPAFGWGSYSSYGVAPSEAPAPASDARGEIRTGILRLELEPSDARANVYVDGLFIGTPADFNNEIPLEAGSHAVEVRGDGFETVAFNARIVGGQSITYRGTLRGSAKVEPPPARPAGRDPGQAPAPSAPASSQTFYYIPGCYMGNVPPQQIALPATCDLSQLVTRTPGK